MRCCPWDCPILCGETVELLLVKFADMLRSDLANIKQQLTKQLAHYQSACLVVGGVQTTESMLRYVAQQFLPARMLPSTSSGLTVSSYSSLLNKRHNSSHFLLFKTAEL